MSTYSLTGKYETILSSLSNELSVKAGKRVSKRKVLEMILEIVIEEERLLVPNDTEQPVSFFRRNIYKLPNHTKNTKSPQEIIDHLYSLVNKK